MKNWRRFSRVYLPLTPFMPNLTGTSDRPDACTIFPSHPTFLLDINEPIRITSPYQPTKGARCVMAQHPTSTWAPSSTPTAPACAAPGNGCFVFSSQKYNKSTTSTLHEVVSSSCIHPSSSGAEPQETSSTTHILARILFARANSLQFWPWTAKFTGMAEQISKPTPNPSLRLYDVPILTQIKSLTTLYTGSGDEPVGGIWTWIPYFWGFFHGLVYNCE